MANERRLELQGKLKELCPNVYFQPPSNISLNYPCIIYHKDGVDAARANDSVYTTSQQYQVTVIEKDPDSDLGDQVLHGFEMCVMIAQFTMDNLNHTSLNLTY